MHRRRFITFTLTALGLNCWPGAAPTATTFARSQTSTTAPSLPKGKAGSGAFRFVALGDTGTGGAGQLAVAGQMTAFHEERPYDTVLLLGDNIYPDGDPAALAERFERPYAGLLRGGVRFHAVLGNHDVQRSGAAASARAAVCSSRATTRFTASCTSS